MSQGRRGQIPRVQGSNAINATVPRPHDGLSTKSRPSALPRSTSSNSGARLDALASSRPLPPRIPLHKQSSRHSRSASEDVPLIFDSIIPSNYQHQASITPSSDDFREMQSALDSKPDMIFGLEVPGKSSSTRSPELPARLIPELQALAGHRHYQQALPPSSISTISSPSTRFTESPAPWSASTTTTTPVSWPSSSPAVVQMIKPKSKTVPIPREPRSRLPKLPTPRPTEVNNARATKEQDMADKQPARNTRRKKSLLDSPAPTPPPRTSSVKRSASSNRSGASSIDDTLARAEPTRHAQSTKPNQNAPDWETSKNIGTGGAILDVTSATHTDLQHSIRAMPTRPSREGTTDLGESRPMVMNDHKAGFSNKHRQLLASAFEDTDFKPKEQSLGGSGSATVQRSPSRLGRLGRLGMFGRRNANADGSELEKSPKKLQRRGPTAGTGHEGYGRYAKRGRKASSEESFRGSDSDQSISSVKRTPLLGSSRKNSISSSRHNRSSQSDLDDFAATRMKPITIRGGSQTSIARSNLSMDQPRSRTGTPAISQPGAFEPVQAVRPQPSGVTTPVRSPLQDITNSRANSPARLNAPRLALRRSQKFSPDRGMFRIPSPIRTTDLTAPVYVTSYDTSQPSMPPSSAAPSIETSDGQYAENDPTKAGSKKTRKQWWNPFRRRHQQPTTPYVPPPILPEAIGMPVSIAAGPTSRSIPYYAVMESESENNTTEAIGQFLSQAAESPSASPKAQTNTSDETFLRRRTESILLPAAPVWSEDVGPPSPSLSQLSRAESPLPDASAAKQPRLVHVGRIPKVVNRTERQHIPSRRSFSQPFAKPGTLEEMIRAENDLRALQIDRPQLEIHTDVLPSRPFSGAEAASAKPASAPARTMYPKIPTTSVSHTTQHVLTTVRHESDVSYSSSSDGIHSVMGPPIVPSQRERELRAHVPALRIASGLPGDDEVWNEYDDFLDHVMSPSKAKRAREVLGLRPVPPLHKTVAQKSSSPVRGGVTQTRSRPNLAMDDPRRAVLDLPLQTSLLPPVLSPPSSMLTDRYISEEIRLRRSRIVSALHSSLDPASPFSMREFLKDYGPRGPESVAATERFSGSTGAEYLGLVTPIAGAFLDGMKVGNTHDENAHSLDTVERARDPARQSELHYASLEVARWLSFGRVLFSPAHEEIQILPDRNVLVIDGLGNEDWSIYCAVTYERERAVIYDLKEDSNSGLSQMTRDSAHTPANHHRRAVQSLSDRFPFHSAFFSAIVLRFPPVMSEAKMRSIITECRRVLVPGGHVEIMLLELDIVNMGAQTRRAVRELKMRMTDTAPDLDLKPTIDSFQSLLGGHGFSGLNRCVVGVPVTGRPAGSVDSSTSSRSSRGSGIQPQRTSNSSVSKAGPPARSHNFSLNDLVADHSENADAKIGRMVSRTARSWWQHCYEADTMVSGGRLESVFSDKRVMQECKTRASSFKLLIAYAQRPVFESKRRTMSESGSSTTATVGAQRRGRPSP